MIRRAIFRLWLIGSVLWGAFVLLISLASSDWPDNAPRMLVAGLGFPLAILALGKALRWAFGGYRQGA